MTYDQAPLAGPWDGSVPDAATAVIKRIETFAALPYNDQEDGSGTWTIGWGAIRDADGNAVTPDTPAVDEAGGQALLLRDLGDARAAVAASVHVPLLTREAAALISWTFNLGDGALRSSTMLRLLNAGGRSAVPGQMRLWILVRGKPSLGLLRRRWAEAAIFVGVDPGSVYDLAWNGIQSLGEWPPFGV